MVGRASERWTYIDAVLKAVQNIFWTRSLFGHPMEGVQSFFPIFATHQILGCTPNLKRPWRKMVYSKKSNFTHLANGNPSEVLNCPLKALFLTANEPFYKYSVH